MAPTREQLLAEAGYPLDLHRTEIVPGRGPQGQPVFVQRMPVLFKENANRGKTVFFAVYGAWMGRIRELALWPIQEIMRQELATGEFALITNSSAVEIVGEVGWPEVVECRLVTGAWYGRAGSTADMRYDWLRVEPDGKRTRIAKGMMTTTWARVTGHGQVEPIAPAGYFQEFIARMSPPLGAPENFDSDMYKEPLPQLFPENAERGVAVFSAPPGPKVKPVIFEKIFDTTLEESNIVGNVYFSNYYVWQGRVRDYFIHSIIPDVFRTFGATVNEEPVTLASSVSHLREAMPFDRVVVTLAVRELSSHRARLYFEYFREESSGERTKLAFGENTLGWLQRDATGAPTLTALPVALVAAIVKLKDSHG